MRVWTFKIGFNTYAACPVTRGRHPNKESIQAGRRVVGEGNSKAAALEALAAKLGVPADTLEASNL